MLGDTMLLVHNLLATPVFLGATLVKICLAGGRAWFKPLWKTLPQLKGMKRAMWRLLV